MEEVRERDRRRQEWGYEAEMLAQVHEMLQVIRIDQQALHGVDKAKLTRFSRVWRPGDPDPEPQTVRKLTPREFALMAGVT